VTYQPKHTNGAIVGRPANEYNALTMARRYMKEAAQSAHDAEDYGTEHYYREAIVRLGALAASLGIFLED
jgi:hypothetical protein